MTYSITISPGDRRAKNMLDHASLQKQFGSLVHVGGLGRFFEFEAQAAPAGDTLEAAYLLYGKKGLIGRGFYLYIEKGYTALEVTTPMPTTAHDLEDMFTFTGMLASYVAAKEVRDTSGTYPRAALPSLFTDIAKNNLNMLHYQAANQPGFTVSGVRFPLLIPESVCGRIAGVPPLNGERFFAAYLDDKQRLRTEYLRPSFYRGADGAPRGRYEIADGRAYIAPKYAFVPYGPVPFDGEPLVGWQAVLLSEQAGVLGTLPYETFMERLNAAEQQIFDDKYIILNALSPRRMQEILEG